MSKTLSINAAIALINAYNLNGLERIAFLQSIKIKSGGKGPSKSGINYRHGTNKFVGISNGKRECERRINQMRKANV